MRDEQKFLHALVDQRIDVYLVNGIRLQGTLLEPMTAALALCGDEDGRRILVYKHAISSVVPVSSR